MKTVILGAACALAIMSWSAWAEESSAEPAKPSIEDQCKAMGVQHGMKGDKMDAWMKKCIAIVEKMKQDRDSKAAGEGRDSPHGGMGDH